MKIKRVHELFYESARVRLRVWDDNEVILTNLVSGIRNQGHATELMKRVVKLADDNGYRVVLDVRRFAYADGPDNEWLKGFYERFGFVQDNTTGGYPIFMVREPRSSQ